MGLAGLLGAIVLAPTVAGLWVGIGGAGALPPPATGLRATELVPGAPTVSPNGAGCVAVGDFNGDTRPDVAAGWGPLAAYSNPAWAPVPVTAGQAALVGTCVAADIDSDGSADLVSLAGGHLLWSRLAAAAGPGWQTTDLGAVGDASTLAVGDVTGDGLAEIVVSSPAAASVPGGTGPGPGTWLWAGTGGTWSPHYLADAGAAGDVAFGDLDGDGDRDLVQAGRALINPGPAQALGGGWGDLGLPFASPRFTVADLDGDGRASWAGPTPDGQLAVVSWDGSGPAGWQATAVGPLAAAIDTVVAADLDGNGRVDLVTSGAAGIEAHLASGPGSWSTVGPLASASVGRAVGDLDGDGAGEVVASSLDGLVTIRLEILTTPTDVPPPTLQAVPPGTGSSADGGQALEAPPVATAIGVTPTPTPTTRPAGRRATNRPGTAVGSTGGANGANGSEGGDGSGAGGDVASVNPDGFDAAALGDVALSTDPPIGVTGDRTGPGGVAEGGRADDGSLEPIGAGITPSLVTDGEVAVAGQVLTRDGITALRIREAQPGRSIWSGLAAVFVITGGGVVLAAQVLIRRYYGHYLMRD